MPISELALLVNNLDVYALEVSTNPDTIEYHDEPEFEVEVL